MKSKYESLAKSALGDSLYQALNKAIEKTLGKSVADVTGAHNILDIAPKSILTLLYKEVDSMKDKESKQIELSNVKVNINKTADNQYSGDFEQNGKSVHLFKSESILQISSQLVKTLDMPGYSKEEEEGSDADIWEHLKGLEEKVNQLFMLAASHKPSVIVNNVTEESSVHGDHEVNEGSSSEESMSKSEVLGKPFKSIAQEKFAYANPDKFGGKAGLKEWQESTKGKKLPEKVKKASLEKINHTQSEERWSKKAPGVSTLGSEKHVKELFGKVSGGVLIPEKFKKALKKAGVMPQPPKAGSNVGGSNGLTNAGKQKPATTAAPQGMAAAPKATSMGMPAKAPKPPKPLGTTNTVTFKKSELVNSCLECKSSVGYCQCFKAFSKPIVTKSEKESITIKFKNDWDKDAIRDLFRSIQRAKTNE